MAKSLEQSAEEISRYLRSIDVTLKDIAKEYKRHSGRITFRNYIEGEDDGTTPAGSTQSNL